MDRSLKVPYGYARATKTLAEMETWLLRHHHPEYVRRLINWLYAQGGKIGVGGGWRSTQPAKPGFAPEGKSFHQTQRFADGFNGAAAVDLVAANGKDVHRSPTWNEVIRKGTDEAKKWGLHCNVAGEPWHMQPIEVDGHATWVRNGRPAPKVSYKQPSLPGVPPKPTPTPTPKPPTNPPTGATYTVVRGDTLSGIANKHGITLKTLLSLNPGITVNMVIRPGQKLNVKAGSTPKPTPAPAPTPPKKPTVPVAPPNLRRGSTGAKVRELQAALRVTVDGTFGAETDRALRSFQKGSGLVVDGVYGAQSYRALKRHYDNMK